MKQKTLDILDREISNKHKQYLRLDDDLRFSWYKEEFLLDKINWDKYFPLVNKYTYNWNEFKYTDVKKPDFIDRLISTNDIGVYIFIIQSEYLFFDMPKYVFYVGISGEDGSARPLKDRLKDYFRLEQIKKRKKVHRMLTKYHSNVFIKYSTMTIPFTDLEDLEKNLHGYFYPICNDRDFPIEIKDQRKADLR